MATKRQWGGLERYIPPGDGSKAETDSGARLPRKVETLGSPWLQPDDDDAGASGTDALLEDAMPYGVCLYGLVSSRDPAPLAMQRMFVVLTMVSLGLVLPSLATLLVGAGLDGSWDSRHGLHSSQWGSPQTFEKLLEESIGLSETSFRLALL
eukprot:SAG11_NODE_15238_length_584_cov_1.063918_1_plen_151_part_10